MAVVDYASVGEHEYLQDGFVFGERPRLAGEPYIDENGQLQVAINSAAVSDAFWNGLESVTEGTVHNRSKLEKLPRSGRTLRSPTFELSNGDVTAFVEGEGHIIACVDSHRLIAGPLHGQTIRPVGKNRFTKLDLKRYVGHRLHLEFVPPMEHSCQCE